MIDLMRKRRQLIWFVRISVFWQAVDFSFALCLSCGSRTDEPSDVYLPHLPAPFFIWRVPEHVLHTGLTTSVDAYCSNHHVIPGFSGCRTIPWSGCEALALRSTLWVAWRRERIIWTLSFEVWGEGEGETEVSSSTPRFIDHEIRDIFTTGAGGRPAKVLITIEIRKLECQTHFSFSVSESLSDSDIPDDGERGLHA